MLEIKYDMVLGKKLPIRHWTDIGKCLLHRDISDPYNFIVNMEIDRMINMMVWSRVGRTIVFQPTI